MTIDAIAQSIRDAITPVFLMSGVASVLSVTTSRFSRIVDRYRELMSATVQTPSTEAEVVIMYRRSQVIHWSIYACTICALMVCVVIAIMFTSNELSFSPTRIIGLLFIISMVFLIIGLLLFLYEIHLATGTLTILGEAQKPKASQKR